MVLSNQKLQDSKWSKASKVACHTIDSLPENVKSTIRNLRIAVERMHLGLTKAKELIFETARQLDEEHVEERVKICKKIKEILKDKIQEGKISEGWIEECLPREYKRKYTRTESQQNHLSGIQGDVSNLADLDRLYETVKQQKGRIDVLFANAGVAEFVPLGSISESHFDKIFSVNVKGLLFTVQKALPLFQDGGSIILTASGATSKAAPALSVYSATTAAIRSFARSWTVDLKNRKIRVNAISPGVIETPMSAELSEQMKTFLVSTTPLGRMGHPDEIAKAVAFLASDDSSYITGIELFVDGGLAQI
ncbi:MAG: SDR family oxidoreductase [Candidatus Nitrosopolaris sp.]